MLLRVWLHTLSLSAWACPLLILFMSRYAAARCLFCPPDRADDRSGRDWVTRSLPLLIFLGLLLYVDRIVRREVILDSSALCATLFVAHLLNVCRSSIAHVDAAPSAVLLARGVADAQASLAASVGNSTGLLPAAEAATAVPTALALPWWQEGAVYAAYVLVSVLLLLDVDVVGLIVPPSASLPLQRQRRPKSPSFIQLACWHHEPFFSHSEPEQPSPVQPVPVRISTVVTHCILVGVVLQMGVDRTLFMTPAKVMARSFSFTSLSICWTYVAGG